MRPARRLVIPAVLASALVGASACPQESEDDTAAEASAATEGDAPECKIADEAQCDDHPACMWATDVEFCVVDCSQLDDAQTCETARFCEWFEDTCEHHVS
jgi:hypothetical protein